MITTLRLGSVNSLQDATRAFQDIQSWADGLFNFLGPTLNTPAAGQLRFLVAEEDGTVQLWTLVAGAGVTMTFNTVTNVCTVKAP